MTLNEQKSFQVDRSQTKKITLQEEGGDDGYVDAPPAERFMMVFELSSLLWSMMKGYDVHTRLQRDVVRVVKK